ncbi:MAG: flotillin-like FloA family protein, partial [Gemmatimonadota bacterium]
MEELLSGLSLFLVIAGFSLIMFILWMVPVRLWVTALASGAYVPLSNLIGMRLRKVSPATIV